MADATAIMGGWYYLLSGVVVFVGVVCYLRLAGKELVWREARARRWVEKREKKAKMEAKVAAAHRRAEELLRKTNRGAT